MTLIGRGILIWVDDVYLDQVPDWFPPTDSECEEYFGPFRRRAQKGPTQQPVGDNSTGAATAPAKSRIQADFRKPRARSTSSARVQWAGDSSEGAAHTMSTTSHRHEGSEQQRTLYKTSVQLIVGTFSVTTRTGNSFYGGKFVHVYGFDAEVQAVTSPVPSGYIFTPFTVSLSFTSDNQDKSY